MNTVAVNTFNLNTFIISALALFCAGAVYLYLQMAKVVRYIEISKMNSTETRKIAERAENSSARAAASFASLSKSAGVGGALSVTAPPSTE